MNKKRIVIILSICFLLVFSAIYVFGVHQEYKYIDYKYFVTEKQLESKWIDYATSYKWVKGNTEQTLEFVSNADEEGIHEVTNKVTKSGELIGKIENSQEKQILSIITEYMSLKNQIQNIELKDVNINKDTLWDRYEFSLDSTYNNVKYTGIYVVMLYDNELYGIVGKLNSSTEEYSEDIQFIIHYKEVNPEIEKEYRKLEESSGEET